MGSYLSKPVTKKESTDFSSDKLICGASSMQGWRLTQEDAHNCILDYDTNTSFFAVYDGHGGHEVAEYCSQKLPDFIKDSVEYKEGKMEDALTLSFLKFDALIATPEVIEVLKKMAGCKKEDEESDEEENVKDLYEEATMPIEQVIEKYKTKILNSDDKTEKTKEVDKNDDTTVGTSSACCSSSSTSEVKEKCVDGVSSSSEAQAAEKIEPKDDSSSAEVSESTSATPSSSESATTSEVDSRHSETPVQNGVDSSEAQPKKDESEEKHEDVTTENVKNEEEKPVENGTPSKKGKGKAIIKPEAVKSPINSRPKRNAQQLYKNWLHCENEDSEDESDEEDDTFEGPNEESSEEEEDGVNVAIEIAGEESSEENAEEDEEEEEDDDEEDDDDEKDLMCSGVEVPGVESGCTAVVALLKGNELYVANAGDSRCIVCRNGTAIEMSIDHKPEDEPEIDRIEKAGGRVSFEGRVNDGLNLSRAIGDHSYKQNKELSDREQMITALPDVKKLTINPGEDEFMVLACDGIWNSMSSQEVVDFIKPKLTEERERLSQVCEEIFDHCLAPSSFMEGCDNMTTIIVKFKSSSNKRSASPEVEENEAKKVKPNPECEV